MSDIKIYARKLDEVACKQVETLTNIPPFADCKIRIMPDAHAGKGCVIGFTADLGEKVIPDIVGVDIGCGMRVVELSHQAVNFEQLDMVIRTYVPSGKNVFETPEPVRNKYIDEAFCAGKLTRKKWLFNSVGTLGGGNHFIEIDIDDEGKKYLVVHTGSRNFGKQVADYYQQLAVACQRGTSKEQLVTLIATLKNAGRANEIQSTIKVLNSKQLDIPDELCWLEGENREVYLHDMRLCQQFAIQNRTTICDTICERMGWTQDDVWETVHNYIGEDNIIRKGAISAKVGERVLIPLNMRDGSLICIGKGNADWNNSAPHGAGRVMSRHEAEKTLDIETYRASMEGIYSTCIYMSTIDESPMVYKPMEEIMSLVTPSVDIKKRIRPIYNFKASER